MSLWWDSLWGPIWSHFHIRSLIQKWSGPPPPLPPHTFHAFLCLELTQRLSVFMQLNEKFKKGTKIEEKIFKLIKGYLQRNSKSRLSGVQRGGERHLNWLDNGRFAILSKTKKGNSTTRKKFFFTIVYRILLGLKY